MFAKSGTRPRCAAFGQVPARAFNAMRLRGALTALLLSGLFAVSGCGFVGFPGVYRIDIEQGNLVDQEMIEQLQLGMSRRQVRFIMGSPLVEDTFNPNRWDYPYVIRNGRDIIREAQVTILFDDDRLVEIRGDYLPEWARTPDNAEGEDATPDDESGT
jgi:outer membrane protein assembly factor BamE